MSDLESLIRRLQEETHSPSVNKTSTWRRYDDTVKAMSSEQKLWVCKQDSVLKAQSVMYSQFIDYLFDLNRDAFVSVGDGKYKKVCEDYIDSIQSSASSYISRAEQLEKQNEDLAKRNEELQKKITEILKEKKDESMATSRSRLSRENSAINNVRTGDDSRSDSGIPDLFSNQS